MKRIEYLRAEKSTLVLLICPYYQTEFVNATARTSMVAASWARRNGSGQEEY